MITSSRVGLIEDIVISIVVFLVVSLRNTDGAHIKGLTQMYLEEKLKAEIVSKALEKKW